MYGRIFASMYTGSMYGSDALVFSVWTWVLVNATSSEIEINARLLAPLFATEPEKVQAVLDELCSPDPHSRSPEEEGRRMIHVGRYLYRIVNWDVYRKIASEEHRREYLKRAQRRRRSQDSPPEDNLSGKVCQQASTPVNTCQQASTPVNNLSTHKRKRGEEGSRGNTTTPALSTSVGEGVRARDAETARNNRGNKSPGATANGTAPETAPAARVANDPPAEVLGATPRAPRAHRGAQRVIPGYGALSGTLDVVRDAIRQESADAAEVLAAAIRAATSPVALAANIRAAGPGGANEQGTWADVAQAVLAIAGRPGGALSQRAVLYETRRQRELREKGVEATSWAVTPRRSRPGTRDADPESLFDPKVPGSAAAEAARRIELREAQERNAACPTT